MTCQHLDGNKCGNCLSPDDCRACLGSGSVNYYDSPIPCEACKGVGKVKRIRWSDGGEWCNHCILKKAESVGRCEDCKKISNPDCQLCVTGVPLMPILEAKGHIISWDPATSAWVPCSMEDRRKAAEYEGRLQEMDAKKTGEGS